MAALIVRLNISAQEFQRLYAGTANTVLTTATDGRKVSFPAHVLRRYVTQDGVRGSFRIEFGENHRFRSIERI